MTPLDENETIEDDVDSLIDLKLRVSGMKNVKYNIERSSTSKYYR